jgi:ketosteroid isomerase-like protein
MRSTAEVLENHLKNFGEGNLENLLSDYDQSAVLFTPEGPLLGVDAIRPVFVDLFDDFSKTVSFEIKQQSVENDYAYIVWTAETDKNIYEFATDTFGVRDGKIVAQSFAAKIVAKSES